VKSSISEKWHHGGGGIESSEIMVSGIRLSIVAKIQ